MEQVNKHVADENNKQPTNIDGRYAYPELHAGAPPNTGDENLQIS